MQVTDFVHVNAPRSAPKNWWCRPTALPAAVKNSSKVADGKAAAAKSRTPRSYSARAAQRQAHKPAATAIKPKATAKVKADTAATPHGELKSAELSEAHPATAPAALKQGSKRKHATSVGRQAKRAVDVNFQPAQEESGLNIVKKPGIVERADNAPASAAERSDALQASAPTSTAATAAAAAATAGHSPITSALAAVAGLPADAADVAPSVGFVPAKLTEQAADDAIHAVPPNKRAKTAAGRTASAHDASSLSAFTSRALSDLMEDDVLLEALQDLLAFIGAALPATASTQNAPNADGTSRVDPPQPVIAAPTPAVALLPDQTTAETSSSGLQHNNLHPAGSSMNLLKDGNTNATAATAQAVDRESSAAADTTAPCAMLPASAAVGSAAVGSAAVEHPSNPASGVKHPSEVLSADVHSAGAAGQLSNAGPAPAVVPGSTAQQQSGIVKQAGKRLRGKASVLAKALGLSKSQAVQQRVKSAQQSSAADTNAGEDLLWPNSVF